MRRTPPTELATPSPSARRPRWAPGLALAALCAWTVALPARAGEDQAPAAGGALVMVADPPQLVLGRDGGAELRIQGPAELEDLQLTASLGRIEGLRRLSAGGWAARYRPPPERYPVVALIAAVGHAAGATLDGWLAVPLSGQGDARVPGEPGAEVTLRIGERTFGPARVASDGMALVPVVVPPGVRQAHRGFAPVDLKVPETSLLHAALDRPTVQADRTEVVHFFAYVIAPHGTARAGEAPLVEASRGTLVFRPREPGAYQGTWTLPPGTAGEERLGLRLEGFPASRVVLRVTALPGPAAALALSLDRSALVAGESEEVQITARGQDAAGNPVTSPLFLSADAGAVTQEDVGPGLVRGRLRIGPRFDRRGQVVVRVRAPGSAASASQSLALVPAKASRLALTTPVRAFVRADGRADLVFGLRAWDRFENPAAEAPAVRASRGGVPRLEREGPGTWTVRYRAAAVAGPTPARLEAEAEKARDQIDMVLVPPSSSQLGLLLGAGALGRLGGSAGGQFLAGVELPVPEVVPLPAEQALGLRLELAASAAGRSPSRGRGVDRTVAVLAGPVLRRLSPQARWFASATGGLLLGSSDRRVGPTQEGVSLAARLGVGAAVPLGRMAPFLELGFLGAGRTPVGAFGAFTLTLGVRFDTVRGGADEPGG